MNHTRKLASWKYRKLDKLHRGRFPEKFNCLISEISPELEIAELLYRSATFCENDVFNSFAVPESLKAPPTLAVFLENIVFLM